MATRNSQANTWVIVEIHKQQFAIPVCLVREIVAMPDITAVPQSRPENRGIINLRGRIIPLVDTRKHFGWESVPEELDNFYKLMNQREQDHRDWLAELNKSVTEGSEFRLATDPKKCAFGQWFYSYRPESPWVAALLRKFEPPHNKIHALAVAVGELVKAHKQQDALRIIEQAQDKELGEMVSLFQRLKGLMRETVKELALVIAAPRNVVAVSIDSAVAVECIPPDLIKDVQIGSVPPECGAAKKVAQRNAANSMALILDPGSF